MILCPPRRRYQSAMLEFRCLGGGRVVCIIFTQNQHTVAIRGNNCLSSSKTRVYNSSQEIEPIAPSYNHGLFISSVPI